MVTIRAFFNLFRLLSIATTTIANPVLRLSICLERTRQFEIGGSLRSTCDAGVLSLNVEVKVSIEGGFSDIGPSLLRVS